MKKTIVTFLLAFGVNSLFAVSGLKAGLMAGVSLNVFTKITDSDTEEAYKELESQGFVSSNRIIPGADITVFARKQLPFLEQLSVQQEISFLSHNGSKMCFEKSRLKEYSYTYTYSSFEFSTLAAWDFFVRDFTVSPLLGINFSVPVGSLHYESGFYSTVNTDFEIKSRILPGLAAGCMAEYKIKKVKAVTEAKYTIDFTKLECNIGGETTGFLRRGSLSVKLGALYGF